MLFYLEEKTTKLVSKTYC